MSAKTLGDELHEENAQEAWEREMDRHNLATMTELDYALNRAAVEIDTTNARAELAQLRADLQKAQERIAQLEAAIAFSDAEHTRQLYEARTRIAELEQYQHDPRVKPEPRDPRWDGD